jgi:hypothetical protein
VALSQLAAFAQAITASGSLPSLAELAVDAPMNRFHKQLKAACEIRKINLR